MVGRSRRTFRSVRVLLTVGVATLFGLSLVIMSWVMIRWIEATLIDGVEQRNEELLDLANDRIGATMDPTIIAPGSDALPLPDQIREDLEAVAGGSRLEVILPGGYGSGVLAPAPEGPAANRFAVIGELRPENANPKKWLLSTRSVATPVGTGELVAASPLGDIQESVSVVRRSMLIFIPSMVVAVGSFAWVATGRALRPVVEITKRVRDISSATLSERVPIPKTNDEIADLANTMNDMLGRLDETKQRERQFLSNASHELRSPVAAIKAQLETATAYKDTADWDTADWEAVAGVVVDQVARLDDLVDNLFMLSRLDESADRPVSEEEIDLDELVFTTCTYVTDVEVDARSVSAARVYGEKVLLTSVVRNLVDNASRYARTKIAVSLAVTFDEDLGPVARLVVEDDGPGIREADREHVFNRFARLDEGRGRRSGGAGIGLALVKTAIERHDGRTRIIDGSLGGACFEVLLPVELDQLDEEMDELDEMDEMDGESESEHRPEQMPVSMGASGPEASSASPDAAERSVSAGARLDAGSGSAGGEPVVHR